MKTVFLDLDGTLTDSAPGIVASFVHALEALGLDAPPPEELGWVIGPALVDSFVRLGVPDAQAALTAYRARYASVGLFENAVFEGIPEAMERLAQRYRLCLATAKPHAYARRITAHFGLAPLMHREFGPELDGTRNNKGELLAYALSQLGANPADCVMVGDRYHDFDAARSVGMDSIAVTWGYGTGEEHARATRIISAPADLPAAIEALLG